MGTEQDPYPVYMYIRKEWMNGNTPSEIFVTIETN
jgi:hypothetical protein